MELIQIWQGYRTPSIKVKNRLIPLLVIILSTILLQQKTYGQAGKTNPQITTTNDTTVGKRKSGDPFAVLPPDIERLTWFGERADISPDNKRVAFMSKSFGDAMVIDLQTRQIRCLTCGIPGAAFLRVMHLTNGDYILIGPDHFEDIRISRSRDNDTKNRYCLILHYEGSYS